MTCTQSVFKEGQVETINTKFQGSKAKAFFAANQANHTDSPLARLPGVGSVIFQGKIFTMSKNKDSSFNKGIIIALVGAIFGALVTIVGQPYVNELFEEAKTPKIIRDYHKPSIEGLPSNVKNQISLITTRYSLKHTGGGSAEQITVTINSSRKLPVQNIVIDPKSEKSSINQVNEKIIKIEIPAIRPDGSLSFEVTHSPDNKIQIDEIAKTGAINSSFVNRSFGMEWWQYVLIALFAIAWIGLVWLAYLALRKGADYLVSLESSGGSNNTEVSNSKIASIVVGVLAFNFISMLDLGIIDLPYIPIRDIFYAFLFYILVTNYKAIKLFFSKVSSK